MKISIDFETYSECDLKKSGAWRYAEDPTTEILCMAYKVDQEPTCLWTPGDPIPGIFQDGRALLWAWNVGFEIAIWENIAVKIGFPEIDLQRWRDSMALSAYFGYPLDLDRASHATGDQPKDRRGKQLITLLCKPCKPTKAFPGTRRTVDTHPELFDELYDYCISDVDAEDGVVNSLPRQQLPDSEQELWFINLKANRKGITLDLELIEKLLVIRNQVQSELAKEIFEITGGISATQVQALREWINERSEIQLDDLTAGTVRTMLCEEISDEIRRVLEIRQAIAMTSVKKLDSFMKCVCHDGTVKGALVYYGAGTGRFAGRLFQLHNLPRGHFPVVEDYAQLIKSGGDGFEELFDSPIQFVSTMIRPCLIATPGKTMYDADYSAIEARGTAWLAGDKTMLNEFRSGEEVYKAMAASIFNVSIHNVTWFERFVGKQAILGLGYQMGAPKFLATCINYGQDIGEELAERTVGIYRTKYFRIKEFWYEANDTLMLAIRNPNKVYSLRSCRVASNGRYLFVQLPSGRTITYPMPRIGIVEKDWGPTEQIQYMGIHSKTRQWTWIDLYGGKITENLVQGIARDLMAVGMTNVIDAGFDFLLTVHDQILAEHEQSGLLEEYIELMTTPPVWASDYPLAAEGKECYRFSK